MNGRQFRVDKPNPQTPDDTVTIRHRYQQLSLRLLLGGTLVVAGCHRHTTRAPEPSAPAPVAAPAERIGTSARSGGSAVRWPYEAYRVIAVAPFNDQAGDGGLAADSLTAAVEQAFANCQRFRIVTRRDLASVFMERDLANLAGEGELRPGAQTVFRSLDADLIVLGTISAFGLRPTGDGAALVGTLSANVRIVRVSDGRVIYEYKAGPYREMDRAVGLRPADSVVLTERLCRAASEDLIRHLVPPRGDLGQTVVAFRRSVAGDWVDCTEFKSTDTAGRIIVRNVPVAMPGQVFHVTVARIGRFDDLVSQDISAPGGHDRDGAIVEFSPAALAAQAGSGMYMVTLTDGARPVTLHQFRITSLTTDSTGERP